MISCCDDGSSFGDEEDFLESFARKLARHAEPARKLLAEIAATEDGPATYRRMRNSGEIPSCVACVLRQLDPALFAKLEGHDA